MDLNTPKFFQTPPIFASNLESATLDTKFADPLCKLNLKETSEFVKSFPMATTNGVTNNTDQCRGFLRREGMNSVSQQRVEAPSTPGRPAFNFNPAKKSFPSKWDDAEKWLMNSSSCHESPAHNAAFKPSPDCSKFQKPCDQVHIKQQMEVFKDKSRVTEENFSKFSRLSFNGVSISQEVLLKDKFTNEVEPVLPNFRYSEPSKEGFLFRNSGNEAMKDAGTGTEVIHEVNHRDVGTEMTPLGSSTTSRCHTPFKSSSPARHNTPADRSGPLPVDDSNNSIDIAQLEECHLAKLQCGGSQFDSVTSNWSSREEEEEEVSKSLRHFETGIVTCRKSVSDSRAAAWEEEEKTKCCLRYQREEAKIQAWLNLQTAKAEAQSRKLEVKIQRMKSNLEEKLMKRMAMVHRKAEEWRAAAQQQHSEQIQRASEQTKKMINKHNNLQFSNHNSCGCFPCNTHL